MVVATAVIELGLMIFKPKPDLGDYDVQGSLGEQEEPRVELMFAGIEPHSVISYRPDKGADRRFTLTLWDDASASVQGTSLSASASEVRLEVHGKITDVLDDGSFQWRWKIKRVDVRKAESSGELAVAGQEAALAGLKGLEGSSHLDAGGFVISSRLTGGGGKATRDLRRALAMALNEPIVHLPAEPVGEHAIWAVHREQTLDGVVTSTRERWELTDVARDELTLEARGTATAPQQDLGGAAPFGLQLFDARLSDFEATGGGSWTLGTSGGLQVAGEGWLDRKLNLELGFSGLGTGLDLASKSESVVEPLP